MDKQWFISAKDSGKIGCLVCSTVVDSQTKICPHCHSHIESRKKNSIEKTWIYLITAILLFFPANLLPITESSYLSQEAQGDTIFSSILLLWSHGSYGVAAIIFCASIFTPFFKIATLLYLLLNQNPKRAPIVQTRLYQFIHFVGRWSMIDVFVVSLLGALIHSRLAQIAPGPGIFAFAGVVITTMIATEHFDIRILWDNYRHYANRQD